MPSGCHAFLQRDIGWKNAWWLPNISTKGYWIEKCLVAAKRFYSPILSAEMLGYHLTFLHRDIRCRNTWWPPCLFKHGYQPRKHLAIAKRFYVRKLGTETLSDHQEILHMDHCRTRSLEPLDVYKQGYWVKMLGGSQVFLCRYIGHQKAQCGHKFFPRCACGEDAWRPPNVSVYRWSKEKLLVVVKHFNQRMLNKNFLGGCHMFQCNVTFFVIEMPNSCQMFHYNIFCCRNVW